MVLEEGGSAVVGNLSGICKPSATVTTTKGSTTSASYTRWSPYLAFVCGAVALLVMDSRSLVAFRSIGELKESLTANANITVNRSLPTSRPTTTSSPVAATEPPAIADPTVSPTSKPSSSKPSLAPTSKEEPDPTVSPTGKPSSNKPSLAPTSKEEPEPFLVPDCLEFVRQKMRSPNSSRADEYFINGDFITDQSTSNTWIRQPDASRTFELQQYCRMHRYTANEAQTCLEGLHLNMIGDSLTRYQFLSLAYFLHHESWPDNFGLAEVGQPCQHWMPNVRDGNRNESTCSEVPHFLLERNFYRADPTRGSGWCLYHETVGGGDNGTIFGGHLECQCRRGAGKGKADAAGMLYQENNLVLSLFMEDGWIEPSPIIGWNFTGCSESGTCRYTREHTESMLAKDPSTYAFNQPITDFYNPQNGSLIRTVPEIDIALYNRGIWGKLPQKRASIIMPYLRSLTTRHPSDDNTTHSKSDGHCFYKATTRGNWGGEKRKADIVAADLARDSGCSFLDYFHAMDEFAVLAKNESDPERKNIWWDANHFLPWVYTEFNNILLNVLCNSKI